MLLLLFVCSNVTAQSDNTSTNETTIILVRHAEKVDDGSSDPVLSEEGTESAQHLADWLGENHIISAVYSTDYQRTRLTAKTTAESNGLEVLTYDFKDPAGFLKDLVESNKGKTLLIVGHSNTTPMFANILLGRREFEQLSEDVYDQVFVIKSAQFGKGTAEVLTY